MGGRRDASGTGIGFVLDSLVRYGWLSASHRHFAVFGFFAVAVGLVFGAEACPAPLFLGGGGFSSGFLELLELADCFEQAAFYFLLVALEPLDDG